MLTYGDGVSNVNIQELVDFHKSHGQLATLTSVQIPGRFGHLEISENGLVEKFQEKPEGDGFWINGGFFVLEPGVFDYLEGDVDNVQWEKKPLIEIANAGQLAAFRHQGFWKPMDAMRDRIELEDLWNAEICPWKIW